MKDTTATRQLQLLCLVNGRNLRGACRINDCNYKDLQTFVGLPLWQSDTITQNSRCLYCNIFRLKRTFKHSISYITWSEHKDIHFFSLSKGEGAFSNVYIICFAAECNIFCQLSFLGTLLQKYRPLVFFWLIRVISRNFNILRVFKFIGYYYSNFIHCTNSDFLIGWFVPRDTGLWQNNLLDVIMVV